jgi:signal peptidase II
MLFCVWTASAGRSAPADAPGGVAVGEIGEVGPAGGGARGYAHLALPAVAVIGADQISKQVALGALKDGPVDLISGVLSFRLTYNSGGAFGILQGVPGLFLVTTAAVLVAILMWSRRVTDRRVLWCLGLIVGGGVSNVLDRVFRGFSGRVVDFIDFHFWPVFNVADASIVVGALILLIGGRWLLGRAPA